MKEVSKFSIFNFQRYFSIIIAAFAVVLFAATFSAAAQADWAALEDKADELQGKEQIDAYQSLRAELIAGKMRSGEKPDQDRSALRERVEAKLALAIRIRAMPGANASERRAMAREAARIGMMYVKEGDPERAVRYERFVEGIEASSPAVNLLRNATRDWFREELREMLAHHKWDAARNQVKRWSNLLGDDPSVAVGGRAYAEARQIEIVSDLRTQEAEKALAMIADEERTLGEQPAWEKARNSVRTTLIQDVHSAHKDLKVAKMRESIKRLNTLFPEEEQLNTLKSDLEELDRRLRPLPVMRPFGMVRSPFIRINAEMYLGPSSFAAGDSRSDIEFELGFILYAEIRWLTEDPRTHKDRPFYLGAAVSSILLDSITDEVTAAGKITHSEILAGIRGKQYAVHVGFGPVFNSFTHKDEETSVKYDGLKVNLAPSLAGEVALTPTFTLYGRGSFSSGAPVSHLWTRFGLRYYLTPNSSLSIGGNTFTSSVTPGEDKPEVKITANGFTVGAIVQF